MLGKYLTAKKSLAFVGIVVSLFSVLAFGSIDLDPNDVRPWNKNDKDQFPSPLAAIFSKGDRTFAFVGDRHADPAATYKLVEKAIQKTQPQIIVVESLTFALGENPKENISKYLGKSKEEVWKDPSLGCGTELIALAKDIPVIGGEPTIEEQMENSFLLSKGYSADDIRNVQVLQRIPYRRDTLKITDPDVFFDYAIKYYRVTDAKDFKKSFLAWYKTKTKRDFDYAKVTKDESAVKCGIDDTFLQKIACDFNVGRDRFLVQKIAELLEKHKSVMVVYGTGHFVQEYPAFVKAFKAKPEYLK